MIVSIFIQCSNVGATFIQFAKLANVTILGLKREGLGYTEVSGAPAGRQFKYTSASGRLDFALPFNPPIVVGTKNWYERVWVLIKT